MAGFYLVIFLLMRSVPAVARRDQAAAGATGGMAQLRRDLGEATRALPGNRPFVSLLGVTFAMNFLFFSFMPMVPVLAKQFDVGPVLTGVLASGLGLGMLIGSALMVIIDPPRRGLIYVIGSFGGMICLIVFALLDVFVIALAALVLTGIFSAGFSTVQAALVIAISPPEMRGRSMGLLSMAIGALPFGMVLLGALAEQIGSHTAVVASAGTGIVVLGAWLVRHPEVTRIP